VLPDTAKADRADAVFGCVLTIEVLARSLNARVPNYRPAPFKLLRLGPDVEVPVLSNDEAGALARNLGGRKLYGTQVGHFAAFGLPQWRDWDWLCGRLDAVAHLGAALNASPEWVKATQLEVLASEGSNQVNFASRMAAMSGLGVSELHHEMINDKSGGKSLFALGKRIVQFAEAATGDSSATARWLRLLLEPTSAAETSYRSRAVRWLTHPARATAWSRLASTSAEIPEPPQPRSLNLRVHAGILAVILILTLGCLWGIAAVAHTTPGGAWAASIGVLVGLLTVLLVGACVASLAVLRAIRKPATWRFLGAAGIAITAGAAIAGFVTWCLTAPVPGPHTAAATAGTVLICLGLLLLVCTAGLHRLRRRLGTLLQGRAKDRAAAIVELPSTEVAKPTN
jgi:hypothetical protein